MSELVSLQGGPRDGECVSIPNAPSVFPMHEILLPVLQPVEYLPGATSARVRAYPVRYYATGEVDAVGLRVFVPSGSLS